MAVARRRVENAPSACALTMYTASASAAVENDTLQQRIWIPRNV